MEIKKLKLIVDIEYQGDVEYLVQRLGSGFDNMKANIHGPSTMLKFELEEAKLTEIPVHVNCELKPKTGEYDYEKERKFLFTNNGLRELIIALRSIDKLLDKSGSVMHCKVNFGIGDSFAQHAIMDYLVEINELRCISPEIMNGQNRVYIKGTGVK